MTATPRKTYDEFIPAGVKRVADFTLEGTFDTANDLADEMLKQTLEPLRRVVIQPHTVRLVGVDWREGDILAFDARLTMDGVPGEDGTLAATFQPVGETQKTPSAWWRKWGYRVMAAPFERARDWLWPVTRTD